MGALGLNASVAFSIIHSPPDPSAHKIEFYHDVGKRHLLFKCLQIHLANLQG